MKKLHIYLPIPIIFFLAVFLTYWFSPRQLRMPNLDFLHLSLADINLYLILLISFIFVASGFYAILIRRTTLLPTHPQKTKAIVDTGIFRITRNPIYLGEAIFLFAWSIYLHSFWGILILIGFVIYTTQFQIKKEEEILLEKFGKTYADYCKKVRRWI